MVGETGGDRKERERGEIERETRSSAESASSVGQSFTAATRKYTFVSTACFLVGERELRPATMDDVNDGAQGRGAFYMKRLEKVNI